jgi:hypothetical protein
MRNGIPMKEKWAVEILKHHNFPFLWTMSQFVQSVFQPNEKTVKKIKAYQEYLGIPNREFRDEPVIGYKFPFQKNLGNEF